MIRTIIIVLIFLTVQCKTNSQEKTKSDDNSENWETYLAKYDKGPGSTTLNMSLINLAPIKKLQYIVITGVSYSDCNKDGFPTKLEFENLYKISDSIENVISNNNIYKHVGTFTYQCERLDYFYVNDTIGLRKKINHIYESNFKDYAHYLNIKPDNNWEAYLKFLYPSDDIQDYMSNEKVLNQLELAGDSLTKEREIEHWIYFKKYDDREVFIKYAKRKKFIIISENKIKNSEFPFQLQISRLDNVDIASINKITMELRKKANELNGNYDGWETIVKK